MRPKEDVADGNVKKALHQGSHGKMEAVTSEDEKQYNKIKEKKKTQEKQNGQIG